MPCPESLADERYAGFRQRQSDGLPTSFSREAGFSRENAGKERLGHLATRAQTSPLAGHRSTRSRTDLQSQVLEATLGLRRIRRLHLCHAMEQHHVSRLFTGLSRHHGQRPNDPELQPVSPFRHAHHLGQHGTIPKHLQKPKRSLSALARPELLLSLGCLCAFHRRRVCRRLALGVRHLRRPEFAARTSRHHLTESTKSPARFSLRHPLQFARFSIKTTKEK